MLHLTHIFKVNNGLHICKYYTNRHACRIQVYKNVIFWCVKCPTYYGIWYWQLKASISIKIVKDVVQDLISQ